MLLLLVLVLVLVLALLRMLRLVLLSVWLMLLLLLSVWLVLLLLLLHVMEMGRMNVLRNLLLLLLLLLNTQLVVPLGLSATLLALARRESMDISAFGALCKRRQLRSATLALGRLRHTWICHR